MPRQRPILVTLGTIAVLAVVCVAVVRYLEQNRVTQAGNAIIVIEGRELWPWNNMGVGVGVHGTLGLVGGRCVGFVNRGVSGNDAVIVWPAGTKVSGRDDDLRITSEGETVTLGDEIEAGTEFGHDFSGIREKLPAECRGVELLQVGLNS